MANKHLTPDHIAPYALAALENNLVLAKNVKTEFSKEFKAVGDTIGVRRDVKHHVTRGSVMQIQDTTEGKVSIKMDIQDHVDFYFETKDLTLSIEEFSSRYIEPKMHVLANMVDTELFNLYKKVYHSVGTPGTPPSTYLNISAPQVRMDEMGVPADGQRVLALDPNAAALTANDLKLVHSREAIQGLKNAIIANGIAKFKIMDSNNVPVHTVGAHGGTPLVRGANQAVDYEADSAAGLAARNEWKQTIITDGWTGGQVLKAGDILTFGTVGGAGSYAVNSVPKLKGQKKVMPYLQQVTILEDVTTAADPADPTTITISPPLIATGAYQTVSAAPADNAPINRMGTAGASYPQHLAFHKDTFALVTAPIDAIYGTDTSYRQAEDTGVSIRITMDGDSINQRNYIRMDILYGVQVIEPWKAVRLWG